MDRDEDFLDSDDELLRQFSDEEDMEANLAATREQLLREQQPGYVYTAGSKRQRSSTVLTEEQLEADIARTEEDALREAEAHCYCTQHQQQQQRFPASAEADEDAAAADVPEQDMPYDPFDPTGDTESVHSLDGEQVAQDEAAGVQQGRRVRSLTSDDDSLLLVSRSGSSC